VNTARKEGWNPRWETFRVLVKGGYNDVGALGEHAYYYVVMERMELDVGERYTQDDL